MQVEGVILQSVKMHINDTLTTKFVSSFKIIYGFNYYNVSFYKENNMIKVCYKVTVK